MAEWHAYSREQGEGDQGVKGSGSQGLDTDYGKCPRVRARVTVPRLPSTLIDEGRDDRAACIIRYLVYGIYTYNIHTLDICPSLRNYKGGQRGKGR